MSFHSVVMFILSGVSSWSVLGVLEPFRPNVCVERERVIRVEQQACVQAFTRMVKVWKQGCPGGGWCVGYERRTVYYTGYRQVYRCDYQLSYRCCPGWSQLSGEAGCLHKMILVVHERRHPCELLLLLTALCVVIIAYSDSNIMKCLDCKALQPARLSFGHLLIHNSVRMKALEDSDLLPQ